MKWGGEPQVPVLPEKALVIDSTWIAGKGQSVFFKGVIPGRQIIREWKVSHPRLYGQLNKMKGLRERQRDTVRERGHKVRQAGKGNGTKNDEKRGEYSQNILYDILKN